jgi:protein SCO1/2
MKLLAKNIAHAKSGRASGRVGVLPAVPRILRGTRRTSIRVLTAWGCPDVFRRMRNTAGGTPTRPDARRPASMISLRLGALLAALFLVACTEPKPLPKRFEVPKFTLTERSGQAFDSTSLAGKVWVADFFFTQCPGTCLMLSNRMKEIHRATAKSGDVRFVSISTDPVADTPEVLRKYADSLGADARWSFLTGPRPEIFDLSIHGFKLALVDADGVDVKEKIIHSTKLVLVDKHGWIRDYYDGVGDKPGEKERLLADIKRVIQEP